MGLRGLLDVLVSVLSLSHWSFQKREPNIKVRTRTEHLASTSHHYTFDALVHVKQGEDMHQLFLHGLGEGIVVSWPIQGH